MQRRKRNEIISISFYLYIYIYIDKEREGEGDCGKVGTIDTEKEKRRKKKRGMDMVKMMRGNEDAFNSMASSCCAGVSVERPFRTRPWRLSCWSVLPLILMLMVIVGE